MNPILCLYIGSDISNGALAIIQPIHTSSLLLLVGGRRSPLYPPNKVVVWDDAAGHEVAELEFRERVLGLTSRRGWIAVALKRRVVVFKFENGVISRYKEFETSVNMRGMPTSESFIVVALIHCSRSPYPCHCPKRDTACDTWTSAWSCATHPPAPLPRGTSSSCTASSHPLRSSRTNTRTTSTPSYSTPSRKDASQHYRRTHQSSRHFISPCFGSAPCYLF